MSIISYGDFILLESNQKKDRSLWNLHAVPDGKNNHRCAQMPLDMLTSVCKENGVKTVIRLNWGGEDGKHLKDQEIVSIPAEKEALEKEGILFLKLSSDEDSDQEIINKFLKRGNCLIHCAHGADRTGGAIGGYLHSEKPNPDLIDTEDIWDYTTKYNDWDSILNKNPKDFKEDYYLGQAKKFGVKDLDHAIKLAKKYK